ncbi:hypothetical protein PSEUDO8O_50216 [Pseudomonas sp. 8O]|nr:hypothetical protein PSEUDO8O_50216 [Pseudomonas sp. 8O]
MRGELSERSLNVLQKNFRIQLQPIDPKHLATGTPASGHYLSGATCRCSAAVHESWQAPC